MTDRVIYLVRVRGLVKLGTSARPEQRTSELGEWAGMLPGDRKLEKRLHAALHSHSARDEAKVRGLGAPSEWFSGCALTDRLIAIGSAALRVYRKGGDWIAETERLGFNDLAHEVGGKVPRYRKPFRESKLRQLNAWIDSDLACDLRVVAAHRDEPVSKILTRALRREVARLRRRPRVEEPKGGGT